MCVGVCVCVGGGAWLARHRTIKKMSAPHRLDMGTEQCAVVFSSVVSLISLKLKLLLRCVGGCMALARVPELGKTVVR